MSKIFGNEIRITNIGDYDSFIYLQIHINNASKIGNVKIISYSFDNNLLRVRLKLQD